MLAVKTLKQHRNKGEISVAKITILILAAVIFQNGGIYLIMATYLNHKLLL